MQNEQQKRPSLAWTRSWRQLSGAPEALLAVPADVCHRTGPDRLLQCARPGACVARGPTSCRGTAPLTANRMDLDVDDQSRAQPFAPSCPPTWTSRLASSPATMGSATLLGTTWLRERHGDAGRRGNNQSGGGASSSTSGSGTQRRAGGGAWSLWHRPALPRPAQSSQSPPSASQSVQQKHLCFFLKKTGTSPEWKKSLEWGTGRGS